MSIRLLGIVAFLSLAATISPALATVGEPSDPEPESAAVEEPVRVSPRVILESQKPPKYPPAARDARYTGEVVVQAVVLATGQVGEVKVLKCSRPKVGFEEAAIDAVKKWRFEPGRVDDKPAEVTLRFRLNFAPGGVSLASETMPGGSAPSMGSSSTTSTK
jgi:protein TonB